MKTTITMDSELANKLNKLKYHYGFKTVEQVIIHYLNQNQKEVNENEHTKNNELVEE